MTTLDDPLPAEVLSAIQRGKTTEAIRLLRESTGLGWKEAREIVNRRQRGGAASASTRGASGWLPGAIVAALRSDDPAAALRAMRDTVTAGPASPGRVDAPLSTKTSTATQAPSASTPSNGLAPGEVPRAGHGLVLAALLVAVVLLLHLVFRHAG